MNSGRMNENLDFLRTKMAKKKKIFVKLEVANKSKCETFAHSYLKANWKLNFWYEKKVVLSILCRHPSIDEDDDEKYGWSRKKWKEKKRDVDHVKKYKNKIDTCHFVWESHIYACL